MNKEVPPLKKSSQKQLEVLKQIEVNTNSENVIKSSSLPATTTQQEDINTAGQRKVNLIWEYSQAVIALSVVLANMIVGVFYGVSNENEKGDYPFVLSSSLFLIIGFYFSRTNHSAIGGVGDKPVYRGR